MKTKVLVSLMSLLFIFFGFAKADTLKDGTILYSAGSYLAGEPIPLGVDPYGYNYQARKFDGSYFNAYANSAGLPPYNDDDVAYLADNPTAANHWAWPYRKDRLSMKWNDAWLSNEDQDGDGKLDRHFGHSSYLGSDAWLTNHMAGDYTDTEGDQNWNYFVKIVAVATDATLSGGTWVNSQGKEIGPSIWGQFAVIQERSNDSGTGQHGVVFVSPAGPGVGAGHN